MSRVLCVGQCFRSTISLGGKSNEKVRVEMHDFVGRIRIKTDRRFVAEKATENARLERS